MNTPQTLPTARRDAYLDAPDRLTAWRQKCRQNASQAIRNADLLTRGVTSSVVVVRRLRELVTRRAQYHAVAESKYVRDTEQMTRALSWLENGWRDDR